MLWRRRRLEAAMLVEHRHGAVPVEVVAGVVVHQLVLMLVRLNRERARKRVGVIAALVVLQRAVLKALLLLT